MPRLDPLTEARLVAAIEQKYPAGPERDTRVFQLVCGRSQLSNRREFFERYLRVQDKRSSEWCPWILNRPQRVVEATRLRLERAGRPVRIATLKSRQWGMSRYWLASSIEATIRGKDLPALIIADKREGAGKHLEAGKRIIRELPYALPLKRSNRNELVFDAPIDGHVDIGSAEEDNPARGRTYRFVHATEPAFWANPETKVRSLAQAVPSGPGTTFSWESTANGFNWWHEFWWAAATGSNDYTALFFPWYADPTFDFWLQPTKDDLLQISSTVDDEELWLIEQGCDTGALKWRRYAIANLCFGDLDSFHQEYPARPEEAFLASGRPVFVAKFVMKALNFTEEPRLREELEVDWNEGKRPTWRRIPNPRGRLHVWRNPEPGRSYLMAADVADESEGGDKSSIIVIDIETMEDVAEWNGNIGPRQLGFLMAALGWIYNEAWAVPEVNSFGVSTLEGLRDSQYPRVMRRSVLDSSTTFTSDKIGWSTTRINKPVVIDEIRLVLQQINDAKPGEDFPRIRSKESLREMLTMTIDDKGHYNAPKGKHDDRVMARGIAYHARRRAYAAGFRADQVVVQPTTQSERHWAQYRQEMQRVEAAVSGEDMDYDEAPW